MGKRLRSSASSMASWDDDEKRDLGVMDLIERCRSLFDPWLAEREQEVQLDLLSDEETQRPT